MNNLKILEILNSRDLESFLLGLKLLPQDKFIAWANDYGFDHSKHLTYSIYKCLKHHIEFILIDEKPVILAMSPGQTFIQHQSEFVNNIKQFFNEIS